jgi:hypothetical protein
MKFYFRKLWRWKARSRRNSLKKLALTDQLSQTKDF